MPARSLNKVQLIGNLTRDPELRYTPQGTAVCTLGLATNRSWVTEGGEKREEVEFHRLVAWNKLAELCSQLLFKGRKIFVEGRLQNREWTGKDGNVRQTTEIVVSDMIILDSKRAPGEETSVAPSTEESFEMPEGAEMTPTGSAVAEPAATSGKSAKGGAAKKASLPVGREEVEKVEEKADDKEVNPEDIPF